MREIEELKRTLSREIQVSMDYRRQRDEWMDRARQQEAYADAAVKVDEERRARIHALEQAIRSHRDSWLRGDDKCWKDNEELYKLLPEGYTPPARDTLCELRNCEQYVRSCHAPHIHYTSPQRRIEELEAKLEQATNYCHCAFCAEKVPLDPPDGACNRIAAHMLACQKHPVRWLAERVEELEAKLQEALKCQGS